MTPTLRVLALAGVLLVLIVVAVAALAMVRRRIFGGPGAGSSVGIPLHELRSMHARGELDDAEFEQLRKAALASWGVKTETKQSGSHEPDAESPSSRTENPPDGANGR